MVEWRCKYEYFLFLFTCALYCKNSDNNIFVLILQVINSYCKHIQIRAPCLDCHIASTWVAKWLLDCAAGKVPPGKKNKAETLAKTTKIVSRVIDEYFQRKKVLLL